MKRHVTTHGCDRTTDIGNFGSQSHVGAARRDEGSPESGSYAVTACCPSRLQWRK